MAQALQIPNLPAADDLHVRIQHFYARQMQLLDAGDTTEWARTFTEDGVFDVGGLPEPAQGRSTIEKGARATADGFAEAGITRRHVITMLTVDPQDDATLRARSYAMVLEIARGGGVTVRRSTVCSDVLVPSGETWLVRHRRVTRDGLD